MFRGFDGYFQGITRAGDGVYYGLMTRKNLWVSNKLSVLPFVPDFVQSVVQNASRTMGDVVRRTGVWATAVTVSPVRITASHGRRVFTAREYQSRKRLFMRCREMRWSRGRRRRHRWRGWVQ